MVGEFNLFDSCYYMSPIVCTIRWIVKFLKLNYPLKMKEKCLSDFNTKNPAIADSSAVPNVFLHLSISLFDSP